MAEVGVVAGVSCTELFLDEAAFLDRVDAPPPMPAPTGTPEFAPPRFRFLMMSVFRDNGRTTPCSFRNKPHALHKG